MTENKQAATVVPAYLRLQGAAAYLAMSQPNLQRLHRLGKGPRRIQKGRAVFYAVKDHDYWMQQDAIEAPGPATRLAAA
jgi:hypothetical protein